ncbi:MAG: hypothetical protein BIFFINMI_02590 [Phycisphaerae bacterium]|nr:hypothetical protein [Phycisphaerae bacterium]
MKFRLAASVAVVVLLAVAEASMGQPPAGPITLLDNDSYLRLHFTYRTPQCRSADGELSPLIDRGGKPVPELASPPPPADWMKPDFDDSAWTRDRTPVEPGMPDGYTYGSMVAWNAGVTNSLICARGRFVIDDPSKAGDLKLTLQYVGGVVVYVNGVEVTRVGLPAGALTADTSAEPYPDDLYTQNDGSFLADVRKDQAGFDRRYRRLADVAIPAATVRKGVNVLAVEIHRAPVNEGAAKAKRSPAGGMSIVPGLWNYCELRGLSLTVSGGAAAAPGVARPAGVQVWSCQPYDTVTAFDYGDPGTPAPLAITAARNGVFSARLVVSAAGPIAGLKAAASELATADGAKLDPGAVQVRIAMPATADKCRVPAHRYDALLDTLPAEVPVVRCTVPRESTLRNGNFDGLSVDRKGLTAGALAPLWVTIRVPASARPGVYRGTVTVSADGLAAPAVPLSVTVVGWTLPDAKNLRVCNLGFNSPESLARHYGVPLWSDRHFELMGKSLELMAQVNSRQVLVDMSIDFYGLGGNRESVVRWVAQPDGSYKYDFSAFDKFMDTVAGHLGTPNPLRLNCWGELRPGWKHDDSGRLVSRLDPATGKCEPLRQPELGTPENLEFWKPVLLEVRNKLAARGWAGETVFGHNSYNAPPNPKIVGAAYAIWPDAGWGYTAHNGQLSMTFATEEKGVGMPAKFSECVWTRGNLTPRGYKALLKPRPAVWCWAYRSIMRDWSDLTLLRGVAEGAILRGHDGVGQMGVDIFPVPGPGGRKTYIETDRGGLGPTCSTMAILAPGPDGPVATERYEMLREGMQLAEAILFLQKSLDDGKLTGDLAARINRCLDQRDMAFMWQWRSGRAERDAELLTLAAEASTAMAKP